MSLYDDPVASLDDTSFSATVPNISNGGDSNGLGSLADELAGAFSDDYSEDDGEEGYEDEGEEEEGHDTEEEDVQEASYDDGDNGNDITAPLPLTNGSVSGITRRPPSTSDCGGSDYGDPDDLIEGGISFGLEEKLVAIERLSLGHKRLLREEDAEDGGVMPRLMDGLQKLLPQSQLETGSTRLITAHSALSSHMLHQTRTLRDLSFAINSTSMPPPETAELLASLIELIPRPTPQPLAELNALHNLSLSLVSQLSILGDSLHMARQSSIAANRKLRVTREACADWRSELEMVEKARRWIEDGDWDARCKRREAAVVCRDVTSGFEDVCKGFEEKLKAQGITA